MDERVGEQRNYGSAPFKVGDIELAALIRTLQMKRKIDLHLLSRIPLSDGGLAAITEADAVAAFNALIDSDFYAHVDVDLLRLRGEMRRLHEVALKARGAGQDIDPEVRRTLNRALIHAVYPDETVRVRQFERFAVPEMLRMTVVVSSLSGVPETHEGKLLNISVGGMALILPVQLTNGSYWALTVFLADHAEIETVMQIRHSVPQQDKFLHGIQFVNIQSFVAQQVDSLIAARAGGERQQGPATSPVSATRLGSTEARL